VPLLRELPRPRVQGLPDTRLNENSGGRKLSSTSRREFTEAGSRRYLGTDPIVPAKDRALLERAEAEDRVVMTLDKDFWQIALQRPIPLKRSGVILFRVFPSIPENPVPLVDSTLRAEQSWIGQVSIVTKDGIEMIPTAGPPS
jgi:predicted nuclease of predicted toxin-antitoxin system